MAKNFFESINLWNNGYRLTTSCFLYYTTLIQNGELEEAEEWYEESKIPDRDLLVEINADTEEFIEKYVEYKIKETWKDYSWMLKPMQEVAAMSDIYLEMRSRIKGKGSRDRRDNLAIDFFKYCFKTLGLDSSDNTDQTLIELLTGISLETGGVLREKRESKIGCFVRPKRERFYLAKAKRR